MKVWNYDTSFGKKKKKKKKPLKNNEIEDYYEMIFQQ